MDDDDDRRERRRNRERDDDDTEIMECEANEAAFILGKGGSTKQKIARVCGANIELNERENSITIRGTLRQRTQARDYIGFVMQQRVGSVEIDLDAGRDDMTVVRVPSDCVAFVMGRGGGTLRMMENEWGTLMFFAKASNCADPEDRDRELLMIFGPLSARRGAEMKVMSAVEHKVQGTFVRDGELCMQRRVRGDEAPEGWEVDTVELAQEEFSYALGQGGSTRKKLAAASGCILEYVGRLACMSGYKKERARARDYLTWLLKQRQGGSKVNVGERDDVIAVPIPAQSVGFITGHRGEALRSVEKDSGTFCFVNESSSGEAEELLIFAGEARSRKRAKEIILDRLDEHKYLSEGGRSGYRSSGYDDRRGGYDRYDDRRDDRYDGRRDDRRYDDRYDDRRGGYDDRRGGYDRYDDRRDDRYDGRRDDRRDDDRYDDRRRDRRDDDRYDDRRRDRY